MRRPPGPSISHSSYRAYDQCPRRWLLQYAADHLPSPLTWAAKGLKRVTGWQTFAGTIVDDTISRALLHYRDHGVWLKEPFAVARETMSQAFRFSWCYGREFRAGRALRVRWDSMARGFQPLDRHCLDEEFSDADIASIKERVRFSLENFVQSDVLRFITQFDVRLWHGPRKKTEEPVWFDVDGIAVYSMPDFAIQAEDVTHIFEWKTGRHCEEGESAAVDQLRFYALNAVREWDVPVDRLRLHTLWLYPEVVAQQVSVNEEDLEVLVCRIRERHRHLSDLLHLTEGGMVRIEEWPYAPNPWTCANCVYRGCCDGAKRPRVRAPRAEEGTAWEAA